MGKKHILQILKLNGQSCEIYFKFGGYKIPSMFDKDNSIMIFRTNSIKNFQRNNFQAIHFIWLKPYIEREKINNLSLLLLLLKI